MFADPPLQHNYDKQCRCQKCQDHEFHIQNMISREKKDPTWRSTWGSGLHLNPAPGPKDNR